MSGMDRLTVTDGMIDAAVEHYADGGCMGLGGDEKREVVASILEAGLRELLAHRRPSQAAPAPPDGLREALEAIRDGYGPNHLSKFALAVASAALMTPAPAQEGGE